MVSAFLTMMLMLSPMSNGNGNGHHYGWANKYRPVPAYQPVAPVQPRAGGGTPPTYGDRGQSSGPGANQYAD